MTLALAVGCVAVGCGWLLAVRRNDYTADAPLPTRSQLAAEAALFAVTLALAIGTVASMIGGRA